MTSWLAGVDPCPSPDALSGVEEGPDTPGMEAEPRGCPGGSDGPVCPPCDCEFPVHQFSIEAIWGVVKKEEKRKKVRRHTCKLM
jgi:hypothetical protein